MDKKNYSIKKYRVRPEVTTLLKYLEWKTIVDAGEKKFLLDQIITTYFPKILTRDIVVLKEKIRGRGDKSLLLRDTTHELIDNKHKQVNFTMGEVIEVSLFIYAQEHFTSEELRKNGLDRWGISYRR